MKNKHDTISVHCFVFPFFQGNRKGKKASDGDGWRCTLEDRQLECFSSFVKLLMSLMSVGNPTHSSPNLHRHTHILLLIAASFCSPDQWLVRSSASTLYNKSLHYESKAYNPEFFSIKMLIYFFKVCWLFMHEGLWCYFILAKYVFKQWMYSVFSPFTSLNKAIIFRAGHTWWQKQWLN